MRTMRRTLVIAVLLGSAAAPGAQAVGPYPTGATALLSGTPGADTPLATPAANVAPTSAVSSDGRYVLFISAANGLSDADDDTSLNVYRKDRVTGEIVLVSVGVVSDMISGVGLSNDGNRAVFDATTALDGADTNTTSDVYVRDISAATTTLVSRASGAGGTVGNGTSAAPAISGNGLFVAFESSSTNLSLDDTDAGFDIYKRELSGAQNTTLLSRADTAIGAHTNAKQSLLPSISDSGACTAFLSMQHLDAVDASDDYDAYTRCGTTTKIMDVKHGVPGVKANGSVGGVAISGDGSTVAFASTADNLATTLPDTDSASDVFTHKTTGSTTTELVSATNGGVSVNASAFSPAIDADASHIVFATAATDATLGDSNAATDVFMRSGGATSLVSRRTGVSGAQGLASSDSPALSDDGKLVSFTGDIGAALTPDADAMFNTIDARNLGVSPPTTELVSRPAGAAPFINAGGYSTARRHAISANGRYAVFLSPARGLSDADADNATNQVYRRDLLTGAVDLVSRADGAAGAVASTDVFEAAISADGTRVAFISEAGNLGVATPPGAEQVWVRDLLAGTTVLASREPGTGAPMTSDSSSLSFSTDGTRVGFTDDRMLVRDLAANTTDIVSRANGAGGAAVADVEDGMLSGDGQHVAFVSHTANLDGSGIDDDTRNDLFLRDLSSGATTLQSRSDAGVNDGGIVRHASISSDGSRVAFESDGTVYPGATTTTRAYVRDVGAGVVTPVGGSAGSQAPELSADGSTVSFLSSDPLLPTRLAPLGFDRQAYVRTLATGTVTLVSRADGAAGAVSASSADEVSLSADGGCAVTSTRGDRVGALTTNPQFGQVFLRVLAGTCPVAAPAVAPPPTPPPPATPGDAIAPKLTKVTLTNRSFAVSKKRTAVTARSTRPKRGTTFRFTLSEQARVQVKLVSITKKKGKKTKRRTVGTITRKTVRAGRRSIAFSGRLGKKALKRGRYEATLTATDAAANRSKAVKLTFAIVRG